MNNQKWIIYPHRKPSETIPGTIENAKAIIENISTRISTQSDGTKRERNRSNISNQTVHRRRRKHGHNEPTCLPASTPPPPRIIYSLVSFTNSIRISGAALRRLPPRFSNSSTLTRRFGVSSEISSRAEPTASGKIENRRVENEGGGGVHTSPDCRRADGRAAVAGTRVFAGPR